MDYQASMNRYLDYVTTNGYCQRVKTIVQFGIDNGKIKINPFSGIHLRKGEKSVQFLSEEEVEKIRSTDFHNESLNRVRDLFVFQAASGLSYIDMAKLVPTDFQVTEDGQYYIHDKLNKTGVFYTAVILEQGGGDSQKVSFQTPYPWEPQAQCLSKSHKRPLRDRQTYLFARCKAHLCYQVFE